MSRFTSISILTNDDHVVGNEGPDMLTYGGEGDGYETRSKRKNTPRSASVEPSRSIYSGKCRSKRRKSCGDGSMSPFCNDSSTLRLSQVSSDSCASFSSGLTIQEDDESLMSAHCFSPNSLCSGRYRSNSTESSCWGFRQRRSPGADSDYDSRPPSVIDEIVRPHSQLSNDGTTCSGCTERPCATPSSLFDNLRLSPRPGLISPIAGQPALFAADCRMPTPSIQEESQDEIELFAGHTVYSGSLPLMFQHEAPVRSRGRSGSFLEYMNDASLSSPESGSKEKSTFCDDSQMSPQAIFSPTSNLSGVNTLATPIVECAFLPGAIDNVSVSLHCSFDTTTDHSSACATPSGTIDMGNQGNGSMFTSPSACGAPPPPAFLAAPLIEAPCAFAAPPTGSGISFGSSSKQNTFGRSRSSSLSATERLISRRCSSLHSLEEGDEESAGDGGEGGKGPPPVAPPLARTRPPLTATLWQESLAMGNGNGWDFCASVCHEGSGSSFGAVREQSSLAVGAPPPATPIKTASTLSQIISNAANYSTPQSTVHCHGHSDSETDLWTESTPTAETDLQRFWKVLHSR